MPGSVISLDKKVEQALGVMERVWDEYDPSGIAVAWTGGKDSTVVLHLWRRFIAELGFLEITPILALNLDTGLKFAEILAFRDELAGKWNLDLIVVRPNVDLKGFAAAKDKMDCCARLKVGPLKRALERSSIRALISGIRRDEHSSRECREFIEPRPDPVHVLVNPILEFTEMDVWSYITRNDIPYCRLYDQGYRSLGCRPCTAGPGEGLGSDERSGRDPEKEKILSDLHSLGYF